MKQWLWLTLSLTLAGCGGGAGQYAKPGADQAAASREYQECHDLAGDVVEPQANIDQDIAAARGADIQRSSIIRSDNQLMRDRVRDRAATIIDNCMKAKGFATPAH
jgi:hypothetical protein